MKKMLMALCVIAFVSSSLYAQAAATSTNKDDAASTKTQMDSAKVYTCSKCHMEAKAGGKCPMCSEEMKAMHKMKSADGKVFVCECPADCAANCTLDEADKTKCTPCGKPAHEAKFMKAKEKATGIEAAKPAEPVKTE
jgi:hypothetical protein